MINQAVHRYDSAVQMAEKQNQFSQAVGTGSKQGASRAIGGGLNVGALQKPWDDHTQSSFHNNIPLGMPRATTSPTE